MLRITLTVLSVILPLLVATNPAMACRWGRETTLREQYRNADSSVIVRCVSEKPADEKTGFGGSTEWKVVRVVHDSPKESVAMKPGDTLMLDRFYRGQPGKEFLLLGRSKNEGFDFTLGGVPLVYSETLLSYIIQSPPSDAIASVQLGYFVKHLESSDANVAKDAHREFGKIPNADRLAFQNQLPLDQIRKWLANPQTAPSHLGLYGLLIGQFGTEADTKLLRDRSLEPVKEFRIGADGLYAGFLMLAGESGLADLEKTKLETPGVPFFDTFEMLLALRYVWNHGGERISQDRLRQSMRMMLDRPALADLAINDLGRWHDWSVSDRLMELYGSAGYDIPSTKRAIVRFYLTAEATKPKDPKEPLPAHVVSAQKHLKTLREKDAETVQAAEEFFYLNF